MGRAGSWLRELERASRDDVLSLFSAEYDGLYARWVHLGHRIGGSNLHAVLSELAEDDRRLAHVPEPSSFWGELHRQILAQRVRESHHEHLYQYAELGRLCGVSERTIYRWVTACR
jgi:hypothetical protein